MSLLYFGLAMQKPPPQAPIKAIGADTLSVVLRYVGDLRPCVFVCKQWRHAVRSERRRRALGVIHEAKRYAKISAAPDHRGTYVLHGSAAVWLLAGMPDTWYPRDADLFLHGGGQGEFDVRVGTVDYAVGPLRPPVVVPINTRFGAVNCVISCLYETPADVVNASDLSCCMVAYTHDGRCVVGERTTRTTVVAYVPARNITLWQAPNTRGQGPTFRFATATRAHAVRTQNRKDAYARRGFQRCETISSEAWLFLETFVLRVRGETFWFDCFAHETSASECSGAAVYVARRAVVYQAIPVGL